MLLAAADGAAEGDWLIADKQTCGRGRMGRTWDSPVGNVHASGLVRLRTGDPVAATLALVAAVAVHDAVAVWMPDGLAIKWPNDLFVDDAKLAGILLERAGDAIVIGVGINLAYAPEGLARPATNLAALGIATPDSGTFVEALAGIFADWVKLWRGDGLAAIRDAWLHRAHPIGTALTANLPDGEVVSGRLDGLTDDCALRLRLADGATRAIHAGDVFLI